MSEHWKRNITMSDYVVVLKYLAMIIKKIVNVTH